jgi:hypothetical protein
VTVTGTLTCSEPVGEVWVDAYMSQPVGRLHAVEGSGLGQLGACDVTPLPFEAVVVPDEGRFAPGTADVWLSASACIDANSWEGCSYDEWIGPLRLTHAP